MSEGNVNQKQAVRVNEKKWTKTLMDAGWTVFPSIILEHQHAMKLTPVDVNILMHLARHWWYEENLPHPSKKTIATCMQVSESTVQRRIRTMEKAGLIKRLVRRSPNQGQQTNAYDFSGLITKATPLAERAIAEREEGKLNRRRRVARAAAIAE